MLNKKIYSPILYNSDSIEKVSSICGIILVICALLSNCVLKNEELAGVILAVSSVFWALPVEMSLIKLSGGYAVGDDGIYYKYRFLWNELPYRDIKSIIISNTRYCYTFTKTPVRPPYITVIGGEQGAILRYCMNSKRRHVLTEWNIKYMLGAEIGYYHPGNIWEIFKKGSSKIHNYGFIWNKKEMYKIFQGFQGDYYIAVSILENCRAEFDAIVKEYNISDTRIHFIDDSIDGKFVR